MMSKTHITVGVAASLVVCEPNTVEGLFCAVMGGAIGGILCDIECKSTKNMRDALVGRLIVAGLSVGILIADKLLNTGMWEDVFSRQVYMLIIGMVFCLLRVFLDDVQNIGHLPIPCFLFF